MNKLLILLLLIIPSISFTQVNFSSGEINESSEYVETKTEVENAKYVFQGTPTGKLLTLKITYNSKEDSKMNSTSKYKILSTENGTNGTVYYVEEDLGRKYAEYALKLIITFDHTNNAVLFTESDSKSANKLSGAGLDITKVQ